MPDKLFWKKLAVTALVVGTAALACTGFGYALSTHFQTVRDAELDQERPRTLHLKAGWVMPSPSGGIITGEYGTVAVSDQRLTNTGNLKQQVQQLCSSGKVKQVVRALREQDYSSLDRNDNPNLQSELTGAQPQTATFICGDSQQHNRCGYNHFKPILSANELRRVSHASPTLPPTNQTPNVSESAPREGWIDFAVEGCRSLNEQAQGFVDDEGWGAKVICAKSCT